MSTPKVGRPLSTEELDILSRAMLEEAQQEGLNMAIAGGYAMQFYGSSRFTNDLDIVSDRELDAYQYKDVGLKKIGSLTFGGQRFATKDEVPLDWMVCTDHAAGVFAEALLLAKAPAGKPYRVVPAAHLVAMKFLANRAKDHLDIRLLMKKRPVAIRQARKIVSRFFGPDAALEFDSLMSLVKLESSPQKD